MSTLNISKYTEPCCMCGGNNIELLSEYDEKENKEYHHVECKTCRVFSPKSLYKALALRYWNKLMTTTEIEE